MWVCSALSFWMCFSLPATICKYVITFVALVVTAVRANARSMIQVDPAMPYGVSSTFHIFTPPKWGICEIVLSTGLVPEKFVKLSKKKGQSGRGSRCQSGLSALEQGCWYRCGAAVVSLRSAARRCCCALWSGNPGAADGCRCRVLLAGAAVKGARALGAGMRVPLQFSAASCGCKALLEGAGITVVCAPWSKHAGTIAGCGCKVCWE